MKKVVSFFLAFCICLSLAPAPAGAVSWYDEPVALLEAYDIVSGALFSDYESEIRRDEFCAVMTSAYLWAVGAADNVVMPGTAFSDLGESAYADEIRTAHLLGIVSGVSEHAFAPAQSISREQLARMVYNFFATYEGIPGAPAGKDYRDADSISAWAAESVSFCADKGIMTGTSADTFTPLGTVTRAEALTVAYNIVKNLEPPVFDDTSAQSFSSVIKDGFAYTVINDAQHYYIQKTDLSTGTSETGKLWDYKKTIFDTFLLLAGDVILIYDGDQRYVTIDPDTLEIFWRRGADLNVLPYYGRQAVYYGGWVFFLVTSPDYSEKYLCRSLPDFTGRVVLRKLEPSSSNTLQSAADGVYILSGNTTDSGKFCRFSPDGAQQTVLYESRAGEEIYGPVVFFDDGYALNVSIPDKGALPRRLATRVYSLDGIVAAEHENEWVSFAWEGELYCQRDGYAACFTDKTRPAVPVPDFLCHVVQFAPVQEGYLPMFFYGMTNEWKAVISLPEKTMTPLIPLDLSGEFFSRLPYNALGTLHYYDIPLSVDSVAIRKMTDVFAAAKALYEKNVTDGMSDLKKEQALHDAIILSCAYDVDVLKRNNAGKQTVADMNAHEPYGVLIKKKAVCDGYARTFSLLLNMAGIENYLIEGITGGGDTVNHEWNVVNMEGKYVHVDVTWDDPIPDQGNRIFRDYFNLTAKQMGRDHKWTADSLYKNIFN